MPVYEFNFFDLIRMSIMQETYGSWFFTERVEDKFSFFRCPSNEKTGCRLVIKVGKFSPRLKGDEVIIDHQFLVGEDSIYWKSGRKLGRWEVQVSDLTQTVTTIHIATNLPGVVAIDELVEAFLRYKFVQSGVPLLHGCGFSWSGKGVVLTGRGGIGKTTTAVKCLAEEKALLLGDNWIPICNGDALPFPTSFNLWDYNTSSQVWESLTQREKWTYRGYLGIGALTMGYLRPFFPYPVSARFPQRISSPTPIYLMSLLLPGKDFSVSSVELETFFDRVVSINRMDAPEFLMATQAMQCVDPSHPLAAHWRNLRVCLEGHFPHRAKGFILRIPSLFDENGFLDLIRFVEREVEDEV